MVIHLPPELENAIRDEVLNGRFASVDDVIAAAWEAFQRQRLASSAANPSSPLQGDIELTDKPIWEIFEEENRSIPPEVWADLPPDLSSQHDHYIYGSPKRTEV